jgi:LysM repeat protein
VAAPERTQSPLRLLAPAALVVFAIAFLLVLTTSSVDEGGSSTRTRTESSRTSKTRTTETTARRDRLVQNVYTVKTGDTLAGISEKVGIPVENLLELNPDLDPQALVSGQKIKLRE